MDKSLEQTRWNCKYHVVWAPKFRRKIIYGKDKREIGAILRKLREYKRIEILEGQASTIFICACQFLPNIVLHQSWAI